MFRKEVVVNNKTGLHARPAAELSALSQKFASKITIINNTVSINPKSIISILAGGIYQGTKIVLEIEGSDEEQAGAAIASFIENLKD